MIRMPTCILDVTQHTPQRLNASYLSATKVSMCSWRALRLHTSTCPLTKTANDGKCTTCTFIRIRTDARAGTSSSLTRRHAGLLLRVQMHRFMRLSPFRCRWRAGACLLASCMREIQKRNNVHEFGEGAALLPTLISVHTDQNEQGSGQPSNQ